LAIAKPITIKESKMRKLFSFLLVLLLVTVLYAPLAIADGEMVIEEAPVSENWIDRHNILPVLEGHFYYGLALKQCNNITCAAAQYDNTFGINRFYFGLKGDITDHVGFNFTFDANRAIADYATAGNVFVKYAYLVFKDYDAAPGLSFIVGQQASPYVAHVEDVWGWRLFAPTFLHMNGYLNEADLGLTVKYMFPSEYGDLQVSLFNGAGFAAIDNDNYKDTELKLTLRPFENKNWFATFMGNFGFQGDSSNYFYRTGAILGYKETNKVTFALEGLFASDEQAATIVGTQPSVGATPLGYGGAMYAELFFYWWGDVGSKFSLVARADYLNPDTDVNSNWHYRAMGGLAYNYNKYFKFLVGYDHANYATGAAQQGENTAFLMMQANL
jgi:hypothetical protein